MVLVATDRSYTAILKGKQSDVPTTVVTSDDRQMLRHIPRITRIIELSLFAFGGIRVLP